LPPSPTLRSRPTGDYTAHDVQAVIVPTYWDYCVACALDPVLVIAQMVHETDNLASWWAARPRRNPAGIGVNGRVAQEPPGRSLAPGESWEQDQQAGLWRMGLRFATWQDDAIPAHVGRLLAYLLPTRTGSAIQRGLVEKALGYRPLPAQLRGSVRVLRHLGKAHNPQGEGWASPGTTYGRNVAAVATRLARGR
jgi:hypothetical protein